VGTGKVLKKTDKALNKRRLTLRKKERRGRFSPPRLDP